MKKDGVTHDCPEFEYAANDVLEAFDNGDTKELTEAIDDLRSLWLLLEVGENNAR